MPSRVYRNKKIGEYIRSGEVNCSITGTNYAVVNHHIIGHGYSGIATKAPDYLQMALRHDLHQELHQHGWRAFEEKHGVTQKELCVDTMVKLHADGVVNLYELDMSQWFWELVEDIE